MMEISQTVREALQAAGYQAVTVSVDHLVEVQSAVARLVERGIVDKRLSEDWRFYLKKSDGLAGAQTIIIVAIPQPVIRFSFHWQGAKHPAEIAPGYIAEVDVSRAMEIVRGMLEPAGYTAARASLALKTLAVRSGLAEYGRNNLAYVSGMGSFLRLIAFYSDCPCGDDSWGGYRTMSACSGCSICLDNCPTAAVTSERFLIHAENCLGFLGRRQPDFPYWVRLQPEWDNAFIGCMRCQSVCPVNKDFIDNIVEGPSFTETETGRILEAVPADDLPPDTRDKLADIAVHVYPLLSCNLRELIERRR